MSELLKEEKTAPAETLDARLAEPDSEAATDPIIAAACDQAASPRAAEFSMGSVVRPQFGLLFPEEELRNLRARWDQVQISFVDEPRRAVEQADSLVANMIARIAEQFASERQKLEKMWGGDKDVNTEELRQAIKRYRAFFGRLLSF